MFTVTIIIGNSDDKITQKHWSKFVNSVGCAIDNNIEKIYFDGAPSTDAPWQNHAWVVMIADQGKYDTLQSKLKSMKKEFSQDSIAWIDGEAHLI